MTDVREFKVTVLEEASELDMMKEMYRFDEMGCDEYLVHDELDEIDIKLIKLDEYKRRISEINGGFMGRKR